MSCTKVIPLLNILKKETNMPQRQLLSVIESRNHPNYSILYDSLNIEETRVNSARKAIQQLKKSPPDIVLAEFFYGYSNNYSGIHISNLDVLFYSMKKYAPDAKVIVISSKAELKYIDKLGELFHLDAVLAHPPSVGTLLAALNNLKK
jgi:hypothetical protein